VVKTQEQSAWAQAALVPGALLMAIGADVLHLLTPYWIGHLVARKTSTYGPVGVALAVLLWVYILGRIIVASAGLSAALWYRRQNPLAGHRDGQRSIEEPQGGPGAIRVLDTRIRTCVACPGHESAWRVG